MFSRWSKGILQEGEYEKDEQEGCIVKRKGMPSSEVLLSPRRCQWLCRWPENREMHLTDFGPWCHIYVIYKHIFKALKLLLNAFLYNGLHMSDLRKWHGGSEAQALRPLPAVIITSLTMFLQMRTTEGQGGVESRSLDSTHVLKHGEEGRELFSSWIHLTASLVWLRIVTGTRITKFGAWRLEVKP